MGEAPVMKGEVKEKPAPSGPKGKKRGRTGEQRTQSSFTYPLRTYTLLTKFVQLREQWGFRNIETPSSQT